MKEPHWLSTTIIITIQEELLSRFGGPAGIRERNLLESALGRPAQLLQYGSPDIFDLAAAYAHGLVKNHPFIDGNKRISFMAAYTFLAINGQQLTASEEQAVLQTLALAAGETTADNYATWLKDHCEAIT